MTDSPSNGSVEIAARRSPPVACSGGSRLSAIQRLPPEILALIFWHAIPRGKSNFVEPSTSAAPLLLCRVCKSWRDLAERTPELWSSISLFLLRPYASATQAFDRWIAKSGGCPLSIKVVVLTSPVDAKSKATKQLKTLLDFIRNIALQSYRWHVADIAVPGCFMQNLLAHEAPILRNLVLSDPLTDSSDLGEQWEHKFSLSAAPNLGQLILKQRLRIVPITSHPITSVTFDAFTASQITDLCNGCPCLEEMEVIFRVDVPIPPDTPAVWSFPRLRVLKFYLFHTSRHDRDNGSMLNRLHLPVIRSLLVDGLGQSHSSHLTGLLDRTDGGLESLSLSYISLMTDHLSQYLRRVPLLLTLRLVDACGVDERCLNTLTWLPSEDTNVCPRLQELWLLRSHCQHLAITDVECLIASRSPGGLQAYIDPLASDPDPLKEFRFDGSRDQHSKLLSTTRVKAAIDRGLVWKT